MAARWVPLALSRVGDFLLTTAPLQLKGQSLYSIIKPSDRPKVRQWIEAAKTWAPVVFDDERSGGHGYLNFSVLKVSWFELVGSRTGEAVQKGRLLVGKSSAKERGREESPVRVGVDGSVEGSGGPWVWHNLGCHTAWIRPALHTHKCGHSPLLGKWRWSGECGGDERDCSGPSNAGRVVRSAVLPVRRAAVLLASVSRSPSS